MRLGLQGLLASEARIVMKHLIDHGHDAYMVGGCVRDTVLGRPFDDVDIATSALPAEVAALFERVIPTGEQHGTVTVLSSDMAFEVTTFRHESAYVDARRPELVTYIRDVVEDLRRRDFTMNAMALSVDDRLLDPFGGQVDLSAGRIRCVGEASERFEEDALRMLRAIRFASVLGMRISKGVWRGLREKRSNLRHIAIERVQIELWKLLAGPNPQVGLALLVRSELLLYAKEPLGWLARPSDAAWQRASCSLAALPGPQAPELCFALLALARGADAAQTEPVTRALRLSGTQQNAILGVLHAHALLAAADDTVVALRAACAAAVLAYGEPAVRAALICRRAWQAAAPSEPVSAAWQLLLQDGEEWLTAMPVRKLTDLAVSGKQVLAVAERPAGPWVGACLAQAWAAVAIGTLPNEAEAILSYIRCTLSEEGRT